MDLLKHSSNIKAALFLLGFILVIFLIPFIMLTPVNNGSKDKCSKFLFGN